MTAPAWSKDNPFVDQQQSSDTAESWSNDNPFVDQPTAEASAPTELATPPTDGRGKEALQAIGRGVKGAITGFIPGTIDFAKQIGRTAKAGLEFYLDPATNVYKTVEEAQKLKTAAIDPVVNAVRFPFDASGMTHEEALRRLEEFAGVSSTFLLGEGISRGLSKVAGGPKGPIERIEQRQAQTPVTPSTEPVTDFAKANTPEERAAVVEQLKQQGAVTEAKQADAKTRLLKAVTTWNALSADQRGTIVTGLATTDYAKTWKELGPEARVTVKKALNLHEPDSGTLLDTSQPPTVDSSAPAAQGEGAPVELPNQPAGPPTTNMPASGAPAQVDQTFLNKRFVNPDKPEMSAIVTKNTKAGEKPYRATYFIKAEDGTQHYYIHQDFDSPAEAATHLQAPPTHGEIMAYKGITNTDKLQGYRELKPDGSYELTPGEAIKKGLIKEEDVVRGQFLVDESKRLPREPSSQMPYGTEPTDVTFMDINSLRDELSKAETKLGELETQHSQRMVKSEGKSYEFKFWEKYAEDLKNEMARRLNPKRSTGEGSALFERLDQQPDIGEPPKLADTPDVGMAIIGKSGIEDIATGDMLENAEGNHSTAFKRAKELVDPDPGRVIRSDLALIDGRDPYDFFVTVGEKSPLTNEQIVDHIKSIKWGNGMPEEVNIIRRSGDPKMADKVEKVRLGQPTAQEPNAPSSPSPETPVPIQPEAPPPGAEGTLQLADQIPIEDRVPAIEQSIEDKTQVEKLVNEPPPHKANSVDALAGATIEQLDDLIDDADRALDANEITPKEHERILFEVAEHKRAWKAQNKGPAPTTPASKFRMPDTVGKDLNKFSAEQLKNTLKSIAAMLQSPDIKALPEAGILRKEMDRIFDYQRDIQKQIDEGKAGPGLSLQEIKVEGRPPYQQYFAKKVVTGAEFKSPTNWIKKLRQLYQGFVRPNHAASVVDRLYEGATGKELDTHKSASRLMEMADGSMTQAEEFLLGEGPFVPDGNGGFVKTGAKSFADIVSNIAKGDVEGFGHLWIARRALELKALRNKNIGVDLGYAQEMAINSSRDLHLAVDEARKYHSSLSLFAQAEGLISPEARATFEQETSYGPIQRMYGPQEIVSKLAETINRTGRTAETIMASDEFKRLKGSDLLIRNPVESTLDVTQRILKAAKNNRIALELVNRAVEQPELYRGMIDKFEHREHLAIMRDVTARASAVKAMFREAGIDISNDHAAMFANLLSDDALEMKGGKLLVWREGKIEAWKVDQLLTDSMKSLAPKELPQWVNMVSKPANWARMGIVLDPAFLVGQLVNDQFQGWFNTRYGFVPVIDAFRGWYNIVNNTEAFRDALRAGGVEKSALRGRTTISDVINGPAKTPGELAFHHIKTMHPIEAYKAIITPIREATRMGEYLRARGHGASVVEAAWAARDLLGNYSLQGTFTSIRALNRMSLFLNPAIQVLDKSLRTIKERPVQWFSRAATLAGAAMLLNMANDGDEEIQQLRQTPGGQRWFFVRMPGDGTIVKIRKPYFEGAIFASGMEAVLDQMKGSNPDAYKLWAQAVSQELALNMLPVMGAVPFQLWANKDWHSGSPIIPDAQKGLDPQFQTGYYSGTAERIVGKETGISPAILSYVTRSTTGYLGESAVKGVSAAIDWANTGELPPKEDLPLTQRVFAKYPSYSVKPIQDFYKIAEQVDRASQTINFVVNHSPDDVETVLLRHEKELPLIELFNDSRQQISDLRKAITSVEDLKDLGPQSKKQYTDEFLRSIIEISKATVETAKAIQEDQGQ